MNCGVWCVVCELWCVMYIGAKQLGESGYWTLTSLTPPDPVSAMKSGSKGVKPSMEGEGKRVSVMDTPIVMEVITWTLYE